MATHTLTLKLGLSTEERESLERIARDRSLSLRELLMEVIHDHLLNRGSAADASSRERRPPESQPHQDALWELLPAADRIGGSEDGVDASRAEYDLYGPVAS